MGGLLRALAGGIAGLGQGMIEKAKQDREDALSALARSQKVEDQKAEFAHQDSTLATTEAGANKRNDASIAGAHDNAVLADRGATTRTNISEKGANDRNAATIGAEGDRQAAGFANENGQINSTLQLGDGTIVGITKSGAVPLTDAKGKPLVGKAKDVSLTPTQANEIALKQWAAYSGSKNGTDDGTDEVKNLDGSVAEKGAWVASYRDRLLKGAGTPAPLTGGGLLNPTAKASAPAAVAAPPPPTPSAAPPPAAIDFLKKNPGMRAEFDQKYGQGAAARALGQ